MKTFFIQTLGCKVNHYESEQMATLLRARGLRAGAAQTADLRVVHTCSVTMQAASQSRQSVRRLVRLPMFGDALHSDVGKEHPSIIATPVRAAKRPRVLVTGCWATSDKAAAMALPGVDAVVGQQDNLAEQLDQLLGKWQREDSTDNSRAANDSVCCPEFPPEPGKDDGGWMMKAQAPVGQLTSAIEPNIRSRVNENSHGEVIGARSLPLLDSRQPGRQRGLLKIQDGCDAHCTYCIIPKLRPALSSKSVESAVREAGALVAAGHLEIVLTGIFLGAYGQPTALRRRQSRPTGEPLGELIEALCTRVPGLKRLRLSSLEPGDLNDGLIAVLRAHQQVVPHFHLPLQSGSDAMLRRMNRQYTRDDFLRMVDRVYAAFDRPALTTDIVAGFPGESDEDFERTVEVAQKAGFIHIHAFPYSPRPGTAAARWTAQFIRGPVVRDRINRLNAIAAKASLAFRASFVGETAQVIVEADRDTAQASPPRARHGRSERYFTVCFDDPRPAAGNLVRLDITKVRGDMTYGQIPDSLAIGQPQS
ncbi:MAG TPA: MiaB/RimO family radical SAM methylthiotransferase [Tepidisphaeraceae bacterium]|nr:MiaB/RimO family radical SAM methylthiotransferase [Tepidisphaeraceae bacterium]